MEGAQIFKVIGQRFVDEHRQPRLDKRPRALHVFAADIGRDDHCIDVADHVFRCRHDMRDERTLRDVFRGETTVAPAMDVGDGGSGDRETLARLLVEVGGNPGEGALGRHHFAIIPIEHRAPRVGVAIARRAAEDGEADLLGVWDERHGRLTRR